MHNKKTKMYVTHAIFRYLTTGNGKLWHFREGKQMHEFNNFLRFLL